MEKLTETADDEPKQVNAAFLFSQSLALVSWRVEMMQKYGAASRDNVRALEARIARLEKKSGEQWRGGIEGSEKKRDPHRPWLRALWETWGSLTISLGTLPRFVLFFC